MAPPPPPTSLGIGCHGMVGGPRNGVKLGSLALAAWGGFRCYGQNRRALASACWSPATRALAATQAELSVPFSNPLALSCFPESPEERVKVRASRPPCFRAGSARRPGTAGRRALCVDPWAHGGCRKRGRRPLRPRLRRVKDTRKRIRLRCPREPASLREQEARAGGC